MDTNTKIDILHFRKLLQELDQEITRPGFRVPPPVPDVEGDDDLTPSFTVVPRKWD